MGGELELQPYGFPDVQDEYVFDLFVTGMTPRSLQAISRIRDFCEQHLDGRYELSVIDIYQQPHLASSEQIVATPTLIRRHPPPLRRFIGTLWAWESLLPRPLPEGKAS